MSALVFVVSRVLSRPEYLRVETVHQGDFDGNKGVYHINTVDEVTQYESVVSVQRVSESHLILILEQLWKGFAFEMLEFHSDNG